LLSVNKANGATYTRPTCLHIVLNHNWSRNVHFALSNASGATC